MNNLQDPQSCLRLGLAYLMGVQDATGSWRDYQLPVGESDQWVTAFTAMGVLSAALRLDDPSALMSAHAAAQFLRTSQHYAAGWGYNAATGVDADSTAQSIRLFRALDLNVPEKDMDCLMTHFCADGGVCTYIEDSGWGKSHADVSAVAALALDDKRLEQRTAALQRYCDSSFIPGTGWPTYWWKNHLYSTWHMLALYRRLGLAIPKEVAAIRVTVDSAFELAWAIGILHALELPEEVMAAPLDKLCRMQLPSGQWPAAANLRVTDPGCHTPWLQPEGEYYEDMRGTITTATVLTVLSRLI